MVPSDREPEDWDDNRRSWKTRWWEYPILVWKLLTTKENPVNRLSARTHLENDRP